MSLKLAYLNKKKPIEKVKVRQPDYREESKKALEWHLENTDLKEKVKDEEYREMYEKNLEKYYQ